MPPPTTLPSVTPMTGLRSAALLGLLVATGLQLSTPPANADPNPTTWTRLRDCESGDNYTVISPNHHYYGAYQFDLRTWHTVGGTGYPNQATPIEQDYRALYLYRMRGWQPWGCAHTLRLQPDADAASKRIPTYADAIRINPTHTDDPTLLT